MTVQEFYDAIGGNYDEVLRRIPLPDKIPRFINMFLKDENYQALKDAMEADDTEGAFKAAHNLKGVTANLAFEKLSKLSTEITESLRSGDMEDAKVKMPEITECYEQIKKLAGEL